jgi:hypothetical protein
MNVWIALAILMVILHLLDVLTTYEVVCNRGGIELNANVVLIAQKIGFIPTAFIKIFFNILAFYLIYRIIIKRVKKISVLLLIPFLMFFIGLPFFAVVFNFNTMIYQTRLTQIEPLIQDIPLAQTEFRHQDFCKLIP